MGKTFPDIESLRDHHIRFDKIQCTFCHEEFPTMYDLEDHEEKHRDTKGYYKCDICEEKYKSENYARLHAYCHNPVDVLEEIKSFEINLFQQMMEVSPDIIAQSRSEFELKKETAAKKDLERKRKQEELIKKEKEALEIKKKQEESKKKAEKEALEIKKKQEELRKKAEEDAREEKLKQEELI